MQTIGGEVRAKLVTPAGRATALTTRGELLGRRLPVFFATASNAFLAGTNRRRHKNEMLPALQVPGQSSSANSLNCSSGSTPCKEILDGLANLQEVVQSGGLGNESGNTEILKQCLVPPGL